MLERVPLASSAHCVEGYGTYGIMGLDIYG